MSACLNFKKLGYISTKTTTIPLISVLFMLLTLVPENILAFENESIMASSTGKTALDESILQIKHIKDFEQKDQTTGTTKGGIYYLKAEPDTKYLIKYDNKINVLADYVGAYILRQIIGDRVPLNYIVLLENNDIALASKFISYFVSHSVYTTHFLITDQEFAGLFDKGCFEKTLLPPKCLTNNLPFTKFFYSNETTEINLLADFINQRDYHSGNKGFIVKDNEIINSALIDFSFSLGNGYGPLFPVYPSKKYYAGVDHALQTLKLIATFSISSLDKLDPVFAQLYAQDQLQQIKSLIGKNLIDIKKQITFCTIVKTIITNRDYTNEEFDQLIQIGPYFSNFTLEHGENVLMEFVYKKNDFPNIIKALENDPGLVPNLVSYCFKNHQYHLLLNDALTKSNLTKAILKNIIEETIEQSQTIEHLEIAISLMEATKIHLDSYSLLKSLISDKISMQNLLQYYYVDFQRFNEEDRIILSKLISTYMNENKDGSLNFSSSIIPLLITNCNDMNSKDNRFCKWNKLLEEYNHEAIKGFIISINKNQMCDQESLSKIAAGLIQYGQLDLLKLLLDELKDKNIIRYIYNNFTHFYCQQYVRCNRFINFKNKVDEIFATALAK